MFSQASVCSPGGWMPAWSKGGGWSGQRQGGWSGQREVVW